MQAIGTLKLYLLTIHIMPGLPTYIIELSSKIHFGPTEDFRRNNSLHLGQKVKRVLSCFLFFSGQNF